VIRRIIGAANRIIIRCAIRMRMDMRTTLALDDDLVAQAQELTGVREKTALVREALRALIQRESARRLARLGGSEPELTETPRRRRLVYGV
jgi:Arc/MetJ family transcription regulator